MAPQDCPSTEATDSNAIQSAKKTPPDTYTSLKARFGSKTLTRSLPVTRTALVQVQLLPFPVKIKSMVCGSSP